MKSLKLRKRKVFASLLVLLLLMINIFPAVALAAEFKPGKPITPGEPIKPGEAITPGDSITPGTPIIPGQPNSGGEGGGQNEIDLETGDMENGEGSDAGNPGNSANLGDPGSSGDTGDAGDLGDQNQINPETGELENGEGAENDTNAPDGENGGASNSSTSPYTSDDSKLDDPNYYLGKLGGIGFTSGAAYLAHRNGHRLLQVIDGKTGQTTAYLVTGTNKTALPANAPWYRKLGTPVQDFLTATGRNGKKVKDESVKRTLGLFGGKKEATVLPPNNHYTNAGSALKHGLTKSGGWIINGAIASYGAYQQHGFANSDFAATAITETAFGVGASAVGSAVGTMAAGALASMTAGAAVGTAVPIPLVGTVVGAVAGVLIGVALETEVGRKVKDFVRTGVKKGVEAVAGAAKKGWETVKGWFS